MTTLAVLAAFGVVIAVTAEAVRYRQLGAIAAKDQRIRQLEADLAEANALVTWSLKEWNK